MRNLRLISSEKFFLEDTMILGQKLIVVFEFHTIFCPTHQVLHVNCMTSLSGHCMPCCMVRSMLNDLVFSSLFMLAIMSIKKIGLPKLYSLFSLNIWVATKKG